jgi:hypothetical protein
MWNAPMVVVFSPGIKQTHPSGNRHPSNFVPDPLSSVAPGNSQESEMVLIDGERISTKCVLEAAVSIDGMTVEIEKIRFEVGLLLCI